MCSGLPECEMGTGLQVEGILNLVALFLYGLSQVHQTKQRFHWFFRPVKSFNTERSYCIWTKKLILTTFHYLSLIFRILPIWSLILGTGIAMVTLPILKIQPFRDVVHYIIAGVRYFTVLSRFPFTTKSVLFMTERLRVHIKIK